LFAVTDMNPGTEATRVAIECLTLWIEPGKAARVAAAEHIAAIQHNPGGPGPDQIIKGLLNLSMFFELVKERGVERQEDYDAKAREVLQNLSPRLPE